MKKYSLLFDGTLLINDLCRNGARSGRFFVAQNLLEQFLRRNDIKLYLYCDLRKFPYLHEYLKLHNLEHIEIINEIDKKYLHNVSASLVKMKDNCPKKEHPIRRSFINIGILLTSCVLKLLEKLPFKPKYTKKLKNIDFYFSPCQVVPKYVKLAKNVLASVYLHDTIPLLFPENFSSGSIFWFTNLVKNLSEKEIYFANSECTKKDFLKFVPALNTEQITVAPLAALEKFKQQTDAQKIQELRKKYNIPNGKYIFSLCTLEPRKNLVFTIKNFINFIKKNNIEDLNFVLGGAAWDSFIAIWEKEIKDLGEYKSKIIKAGYVDDNDLPYLYSDAFCLAYTSKYEGFGMPVLEAMQCGTPVITSNVSSLPEVIGDAGIQISPDNDDECIKAFEMLYFDEKIRQEYSQKGMERAKMFSWKKCADIIIEELIKQKALK